MFNSNAAELPDFLQTCPIALPLAFRASLISHSSRGSVFQVRPLHSLRSAKELRNAAAHCAAHNLKSPWGIPSISCLASWQPFPSTLCNTSLVLPASTAYAHTRMLFEAG